jgi:hypothetical protein
LNSFFVSFILLSTHGSSAMGDFLRSPVPSLLSGTGLHGRGGFAASFVTPLELITVHVVIRLGWTHYTSQA